MDRRRAYYSTALTQAQGIVPECLLLFEYWEEKMTAAALFDRARSLNVLGNETDRRMRNIVMEGFGSRFLREPHLQSAPYLKRLFGIAPPRLSKEIILLYALRQHGIFFGFMEDIYWPATRAGRANLEKSEIASMIDRGRIEGKLQKDWTTSVRTRVSSYVMGIAQDFDLVGKSNRGRRPLLHWFPSENTLLFLSYDLHFLGLTDEEAVTADEWSALGLGREDVIAYLNRLSQRGHLTVQDSGTICRIDWNYTDRSQLNDALI